MSLALNTTRYWAAASRSSHDVSQGDSPLVAGAARNSSASNAIAAAANPTCVKNSRRRAIVSPRGGIIDSTYDVPIGQTVHQVPSPTVSRPDLERFFLESTKR